MKGRMDKIGTYLSRENHHICSDVGQIRKHELISDRHVIGQTGGDEQSWWHCSTYHHLGGARSQKMGRV